MVFTLVGINYDILQNRKDEIFIGGGTMIIGFVASTGWKHYFLENPISPFTVISGQFVEHIGFGGFMATTSFGFEDSVSKE